MRRASVIIVLVALVGIMAAGRPAAATAQAQLTNEQILAALLTPEDMGTGWRVLSDTRFREMPGYTRSLARSGTLLEAAIIQIGIDPLNTPADVSDIVASSFEEDRDLSFSFSERRTAPDLAPSAVMRTFTGRIEGVAVFGAMLTWREQSAIVNFLYFSNTRSASEATDTATGFAVKQRDKLRTAFGAAPPAAAPPPSPPAGAGGQPPFVQLVNCSSFTHQEAAQTVFAAYPGDPYGLDADSDGIACEDLPRRGSEQAPVTDSATGEVLLTDDFSDPAAGVMPTQGSNPARGRPAYAGGEYVVEKVDPELAEYGVFAPGDFSDAVIAIDVRVVGDAAGRYITLACRVDPEREVSYRVAIGVENGTYQLVREDPDRFVPLERGTSDAIRRGNVTNRIELSCSGSTISVTANGTRLASVQDATFQTGRLLIGVGVFREALPARAEARFDNLVVRRAAAGGAAALPSPDEGAAAAPAELDPDAASTRALTADGREDAMSDALSSVALAARAGLDRVMLSVPE